MATKTKMTPRADKSKTCESEKKLVQARLPFKVISESPAAAASSSKTISQVHKRKLSNEYESEEHGHFKQITSEKKEETSACSKKIKHATEVLVIEMLDDEEEKVDNIKDLNNEEQIKSQCTPLRIKLPFLDKKNKKRKSKSHEEEAHSSDDLENMSTLLNPQKRTKVQINQKELTEVTDLNEKLLTENTAVSNLEIVGSDKNTQQKEVDSKNDNLRKDADTEADTNKSARTLIEDRSVKVATVEDALESPLKTLTPKQANYHERRRMAKEQRVLEEKLQKQRDKDHKEEIKRREREEKEEQKRKEREDKEMKRRQEREEKERKRQEEIDAKNEEKRKRIEAKEQELRKRNLAKEEAEFKAKKAAEMFSKFFVASKNDKSLVADKNESFCENAREHQTPPKLAFRPFQVKDAMKLAPLNRRQLSADKYSHIDDLLNKQGEQTVENLYLTELRTGQHIPAKWQKPTYCAKDNSYEDDDVLILEDEGSREGQAILEETNVPKISLRAKLYKFCENRRPSYYGTWRKRSKIITSRRPFAQDTDYLDYELDSDLEWEEEEPGELLDDSDGEDKDKESEENDDYDVDNEWMVPHGHLSEEELHDEDDDDNSPEVQKVKLQIRQRQFDIEMNKKTKKIRPRLLGCIWLDINGTNSTENSHVIYELLSKHSMLYTEPPQLEALQTIEVSTIAQNSVDIEKPLKKQIFDDNLLKELIRLVHGNSHSKRFLAKEFCAYLDNQSIKPSTVIRKLVNLADWQLMQIEEKEGIKKRHCWVVKPEILSKQGLENISLENKWQYVLSPKVSNREQQSAEIAANIKINDAIVKNCENDTLKCDETVNIKKVKKRVPILFSVARDKQIPTAAKNASISQFLKKKNEETGNSSNFDVILID